MASTAYLDPVQSVRGWPPLAPATVTVEPSGPTVMGAGTPGSRTMPSSVTRTPGVALPDLPVHGLARHQNSKAARERAFSEARLRKQHSVPFGNPYPVTRGICSSPRALPTSLCRSFVVIYRTDSVPAGNSMPSASKRPAPGNWSAAAHVQAESPKGERPRSRPE